ncbi:BREX-3 system P-loop-containing protein BrxF [Cupriavidus plantarum]|uniref:BREX-3 system P-loop-containing protein BrxF n=1 Tax=Cupriavidus plantarum TaxID=942865 RepID=UPI00339D74D4
MIEKLERLVDEVGALHSKLILLIGPPHSGKTALLQALSAKRDVKPLNVGAELGGRLAAMPQRNRHLQTTTILRELADRHSIGDLLLLDNIELLFDRSLQLDPLELLKRHAHAKCVVAVWPGELQGDTRAGRLTYAGMGHPEHQDYSLAGLVPFEIQE